MKYVAPHKHYSIRAVVWVWDITRSGLPPGPNKQPQYGNSWNFPKVEAFL